MFAYDHVVAELDAFAAGPERTAAYRLHWRRFRALIAAIAMVEFHEGSLRQRLAWAWEEAQIAFTGQGEPGISGFARILAIESRDRRGLGRAVRGAFRLADAHTPVNTRRRWHVVRRRRALAMRDQDWQRETAPPQAVPSRPSPERLTVDPWRLEEAALERLDALLPAIAWERPGWSRAPLRLMHEVGVERPRVAPRRPTESSPRFAFEPALAALGAYAARPERSTRFALAWLRLRAAVAAIAAADFDRGSPRDRLSWAWEDVRNAFHGEAASDLNGLVWALWAADPGPDFGEAVEAAFRAADAATPARTPLRYPGADPSSVARGLDDLQRPAKLPTWGPALRAWCLDRGESHAMYELVYAISTGQPPPPGIRVYEVQVSPETEDSP